MGETLVGPVVLLLAALAACWFLRPSRLVVVTGILAPATGTAVLRLSLGALLTRSAELAAPAHIERLVHRLDLEGHESVLEVHAGAPVVSHTIARKLTTGSIVRLAVSQADRLPGLPFADASFDLVLTRLALQHVDDQTQRVRVLPELARVLKPGGQLALIDCWHVDQSAKLLVAAGLQPVRCHPGSVLTLPRLDLVTARKPNVQRTYRNRASHDAARLPESRGRVRFERW